MRLVGHGHPAIRATHRKTLEITRDPQITERATCVVGVGMTDKPVAMAGDVHITLHCGAESFDFAARANSSWDASGTAVIRRSPLRLPDTFATHATAAARDLPRPVVDALRDPAAMIEAEIEPVRGQPCAVLFALDPARRDDPRLRAELAAADLIVAEDEDAARAAGTRVTRGPVAVDGRVLVLACRSLPGATVVDALHGVEVETVGLSPPLAAAAASPSRAALVLAETDPRAALRAAPATSRVVVTAPAAEVAALVGFAAEHRGTDEAVVVQPYAPPLRVTAADPVELPSRDIAYVCFPAATQDAGLDGRVRAAVEGLVADGVPTRAAARALAELTGWPRRRAYEYLLTSGARD